MDLPYEGEFYVNNVKASIYEKVYENFTVSSEIAGNDEAVSGKAEVKKAELESVEESVEQPNISIYVMVNDSEVMLINKSSYILVDILDFYPFDTKEAKGDKLILTLNGEEASFTSPIEDGDIIRIFWQQKGEKSY